MGHLALLLAATLAAGLPPVGVPSAGAQEAGDAREPVYLRLSPEPDLTLTYAHRVRARVDAPPQLGGGQSLRTRMRLRQTPVRIGADSLDVRIDIADISLSADSVSEEQLPDLTRHDGATYLARMTTRGELVRMSEGGEERQAGRAGGISPVQRSVRMGAFPTLPAAPVRPGDSWVDTTRVQTGVMQGMGEGTTTAVSRTTLEELRREGKTRIAELSVVTTYTFQPEDSTRSGLGVHMSGSGSASVRFDVTNGRYLHTESSQDYTVNLRYPDSSRTHSVRFRVDSEAQLVGIGGREEGGTPPPGDESGPESRSTPDRVESPCRTKLPAREASCPESCRAAYWLPPFSRSESWSNRSARR